MKYLLRVEVPKQSIIIFYSNQECYCEAGFIRTRIATSRNAVMINAAAIGNPQDKHKHSPDRRAAFSCVFYQ